MMAAWRTFGGFCHNKQQTLAKNAKSAKKAQLIDFRCMRAALINIC